MSPAVPGTRMGSPLLGRAPGAQMWGLVSPHHTHVVGFPGTEMAEAPPGRWKHHTDVSPQPPSLLRPRCLKEEASEAVNGCLNPSHTPHLMHAWSGQWGVVQAASGLSSTPDMHSSRLGQRPYVPQPQLWRAQSNRGTFPQLLHLGAREDGEQFCCARQQAKASVSLQLVKVPNQTQEPSQCRETLR